MKTRNINFIIVFAILSLCKTEIFANESKEMQYLNIPVSIEDSTRFFHYSIIQEKQSSMRDNESKAVRTYFFPSSAKDTFVIFFDYIQKPIHSYFNYINDNYEIKEISLTIKTKVENDIKYIALMSLFIDLDENSNLIIDIDIDYEYSKPLLFSEHKKIGDIINKLMTYKLWNVFQTRYYKEPKPLPVPDDVEKPKMEDFIKPLNQIKNSKKENQLSK